MVKNTALTKLMSGSKVRASSWDKNKYIVVNKDGQIVDNKGKTFNMMASKEKKWDLYIESKSEATLTDNTEVLNLIKELMAAAKELKEAKSSTEAICDIDSEDIASTVADKVIDAIGNKVTQNYKR